MLFASAARALETTGEVPELTAEEKEVLGAAQEAARAAANQAGQVAAGARASASDKDRGARMPDPLGAPTTQAAAAGPR